MKKIPFKYNPKYWFKNKNSKEYQLDKLQYEKDSNNLSDYEYELAILNLDFKSDAEKKLDNYILRLNELEFKYNKIDEYTYTIKNLIVLEKDELEFKKKELEIKYTYNKIKEIDYLKEKATLNNKPFVALRPNYEETEGDDFYLEIECNDIFIDKLKKQGYTGDTKEELLDQWLKYKMINSFDNIDELINNVIPTTIRKIDIDNSGKKIYT
nr:MAG TPA: hypothetical protein [Caudoviricetes sp.]